MQSDLLKSPAKTESQFCTVEVVTTVNKRTGRENHLNFCYSYDALFYETDQIQIPVPTFKEQTC